MNQFLAMLAGMDAPKLLAAVLVFGGGYYVFGYGMGENLQKIEKSISDLKVKVQAEEKKKKDTDFNLAEEKRMKEAVVLLSEKYQVISKKLPTEVTTLELNTSVETYARETQVKITGTKPGIPEKMEIVNEVPLDVTLEGKYPDILQFIFNVSTAERMTKIKSFTLTPLRGDDRLSLTGRLRFDGVVVGYKLAPEVEEPQPKQPAKGRRR